MSRQDRTRTSMRELIDEAERREIAGAEWMDRAALVRALETTDADASLGPLARARRFLGQVTGLGRVAKVVRGAIDPARPESPTLVTYRARAEVDEVVSDVRVTPVIEETAAPASEAPITTSEEIVEVAPVAPGASELLGSDPSFGGMRVVNRDGRAWLVWRAPSSRIAAIGRGTELTLRVVSIGCAIGERDAEVVVETADESGLALEGVRLLPTVRSGQCVAAIGVGRGEAFVAVAHARVA